MEKRVPKNHLVRSSRTMVDAVLRDVSPICEDLLAKTDRQSIAMGKLVRTLLFQMPYSVRKECGLLGKIACSFLFRWFVGLSMDGAVWKAAVLSKNRHRLRQVDGGKTFFELLAEEGFGVEQKLLKACAGQKSFQ